MRVDTHLYPGYEVNHYYDNLLMKLIVWGENRRTAIRKLAVALDELTIEGVKTNISFLKKLISNREFLEGTYTTRTLENVLVGT